MTHSVLMIPYVPLDGRRPDASNIDIPPIDLMALGNIYHQTLLVRTSIHDLHLREPDPLFVAGSRWYTRHHHELHELLGLCCQLLSLRLFESVVGRRYLLVRKRLEELS